VKSTCEIYDNLKVSSLRPRSTQLYPLGGVIEHSRTYISLRTFQNAHPFETPEGLPSYDPFFSLVSLSIQLLSIQLPPLSDRCVAITPSC